LPIIDDFGAEASITGKSSFSSEYILAPDFDVSVQDEWRALTVAVKASIRHEAVRRASWEITMELIMMAMDIIVGC